MCEGWDSWAIEYLAEYVLLGDVLVGREPWKMRKAGKVWLAKMVWQVWPVRGQHSQTKHHNKSPPTRHLAHDMHGRMLGAHVRLGPWPIFSDGIEAGSHVV
jgi:hypothetical protein